MDDICFFSTVLYLAALGQYIGNSYITSARPPSDLSYCYDMRVDEYIPWGPLD